jgi:hypothetical protein
VDAPGAEISRVAKDVLASSKLLLASDIPISERNDAFLAEHSQNPSHIRSGLKVRQLIDPESQPRNEKDLAASLDLQAAGLSDFHDGMALLTEWNSAQEVKDTFRDAAQRKWPDASTLQEN